MVGLANDAGASVRRAAIMRRSESLQSQNPISSRCQMIRGSAADSTQPDYDYVKRLCHLRYW